MMKAYELAKAQQAYSPPTLEEIIKQQADRIAELEKQGEPVAWWTGKYEDEGEDFMFPNTRQAHIDHPQSETHKFFSIPLYTTPQTKELSDEEIDLLWKKLWDSLPTWMQKDISLMKHSFARAILKKASEK